MNNLREEPISSIEEVSFGYCSSRNPSMFQESMLLSPIEESRESRSSFLAIDGPTLRRSSGGGSVRSRKSCRSEQSVCKKVSFSFQKMCYQLYQKFKKK